MNQEELYNSFIALVEKGDEDAARMFLVDHLNEFPEEMRKEIAFAFFVDAVKKDMVISEAQKKGLEIMKDLDEVQMILSDASKAAALKEEISQ